MLVADTVHIVREAMTRDQREAGLGRQIGSEQSAQG
jgi:hypothetical protein